MDLFLQVTEHLAQSSKLPTFLLKSSHLHMTLAGKYFRSSWEHSGTYFTAVTPAVGTIPSISFAFPKLKLSYTEMLKPLESHLLACVGSGWWTGFASSDSYQCIMNWKTRKKYNLGNVHFGIIKSKIAICLQKNDTYLPTNSDGWIWYCLTSGWVPKW